MQLPKFKERHYEVPIRLLIQDAEELTKVAVRAVLYAGSGGFPARPPKKSFLGRILT